MLHCVNSQKVTDRLLQSIVATKPYCIHNIARDFKHQRFSVRVISHERQEGFTDMHGNPSCYQILQTTVKCPIFLCASFRCSLCSQPLSSIHISSVLAVHQAAYPKYEKIGYQAVQLGIIDHTTVCASDSISSSKTQDLVFHAVPKLLFLILLTTRKPFRPAMIMATSMPIILVHRDL